MSPRKRNQKLLGYTRVSRMREDGISPELQRQAIEAYAIAHGHEIIWLEADLDESGKSLDRPSMRRALRLLAEGKADGIIAARLDRLTRKVGDLGKLLELAHTQDWNLVAIDLGVDLTTANGKMVANILGTLAEWELDRRRESWAEARSNATKRGAHIGTVPAGYDRIDGKLVPNRWAPKIVAAFEMRAAQKSITEIGDYLREAGVPAINGQKHEARSKWSGPGVRALLSNRTYLGQVRSGDYIKEDAHEAIIPANLFRRVQRVSPENSRKRTRGSKPAALLQGIVKCETCGGPMSRDTSKRPDGTLYEMYRCRGTTCKKRAVISLEKLDSHVTYLVSELQPTILRNTRPDRGEELQALGAELRAVEGEIDEAVAAFATAAVSPTLRAKALAQLETRKADVEARLSTVEAPVAFTVPEGLEKEMKVTPQGLLIREASLQELLYRPDVDGNVFLRKALERVDVAPGRAPIYERATVIFKQS